MPKYTIVYVSDEGIPRCFGTFATRKAAHKHQLVMEDDLDAQRDIAGGGAGSVWTCPIETLNTWDND